MKGTVDGDVYVDDMTNPTALAVVVPVDPKNKQSTKCKHHNKILYIYIGRQTTIYETS